MVLELFFILKGPWPLHSGQFCHNSKTRHFSNIACFSFEPFFVFNNFNVAVGTFFVCF